MSKTAIFVLALLTATLALSIIFFMILHKQFKPSVSRDDFEISSTEFDGIDVTLLVPPVCNNSLIINNTDGHFIKTACYIAHVLYDPTPYDNASSVCEKYGMSLYKFDTVESYDGWLQLANIIWPSYYGAATWVNGRREQECTGTFEIVEGEKKSPILGDVKFSEMNRCAKCLRMIQHGRIYHASPWSCEKPMTFFCEFTVK
jgi:hypothetical protein